MDAPAVALIAGATGAAASRLVELLASEGWVVFALCRSRRPASQKAVTFVPVDLMDPVAVASVVADLPAVTHVVYSARAKHGEGGSESVVENVAMLRHVLDAATAHSSLRHIHLVEGGKWYGQHLGPYTTPAREDDPRHLPPNFYYDQEDLLRARQADQCWTWSASRPNVIVDFAPGRPRNIISIVGAYAAICRELALPLDFPGEPKQFSALTEITDATHFARAVRHIMTTPACANAAFNVTNGDVFRWQHLWPRIADAFGLQGGVVRPFSLAEAMRDRNALWQSMVAKHRLRPDRLEEIALWSFADALFRQTFDVVSSTTRLRRAGFSDIIDSEEQFLTLLARYRDARVLP